MEYALGKRQVVMNFSLKFCKTENEVLSSECFSDVWGRYVKHLYKTENQNLLRVLKIFPKSKVEVKTISLFKLLLSFSVEEIASIDPFYNQALEMSDVLYDLVQNFYDYWRKLERYSVIYSKDVLN